MRRFYTLDIPASAYFRIGCVLLVYMPQYWMQKVLWRAMDYYLPATPPASVNHGFEVVWLAFAALENVKAVFRACCSCCLRGNQEATKAKRSAAVRCLAPA